MKSSLFKFICLAGALLGLAVPSRLAAQPRQFDTPDDAVKALVEAGKARDMNALDAIFGPDLHSLVSPDAVEASNRLDHFSRRISEKCAMERSDGKVTLDLGYDQWPFPIPIVLRDGKWAFDTAAGKEEILNRRIGTDELKTIGVCDAYVDAQHEYASQERMGDGVLQYAQSLRSNPGKHDGLYWHAAAGEEMSPFGPLIAESHGEGYRSSTKIMTAGQNPYHGYYFKILTQQGKHAAGGKYNYIINGRMIAGFALVAWPAEWGNTGVMTFIVNQDGKIYEKCLGPKTDSLAPAMTTFDPDPTWKSVTEP